MHEDASGITSVVIRIQGKARIDVAGGKTYRFETRCTGVNEKDSGGGVARCTWTASPEDTIVIDFSGKAIGPMGTSRISNGRIIAGSGQFAGITGELDMDWLFIDSVFEEGKVIGKSTELKGNWALSE